jgi:hypothetical protein
VEWFRSLSLNAWGLDYKIHNQDFGYLFKKDVLQDWCVVYFMHSIAHIENIDSILKGLNTNSVVVITPNKDWLNLQSKENYSPDKTVLNHYNQTELVELFESCGYSIESVGQFGEQTQGQNERIFLKANKVL